MNKFAFGLLSVVTSCLLAATAPVSKYDKDIKTNANKLQTTTNAISQTDKKIQQLAAEISNKNNQLNSIQTQIIGLNKLIAQNKETINTANAEVSLLEKSSEDIINQKKEKENRFVSIVAEEFSATKAREIKKQQTKNDLIANEVYTILNGITKDELQKLDIEYASVNLDKKEKENKIAQVKSYLKDINNKKERLKGLETEQLNSIASLEQKHKEYQNELAKIQSIQANLSNILKKLNILKSQEVQKPKVANTTTSQKRKNVIDDINETQRQEYKIVSPNINVDVKKIGSSTGDIKIARYAGAKTISPLKNFSVVKKFGKYYDTVYNIEFFNESVTLLANDQDSKVYCILPGKVIYEKTNQSVLDNVIIIQHPNGLHTIYSHLEQISPTVETGKYLEKGYVIGRVSKQLVFQVTQNSAFVDPMDVIN